MSFLEPWPVGDCHSGELGGAEGGLAQRVRDEVVDGAGVRVHREGGDDAAHPHAGLRVDPLGQHRPRLVQHRHARVVAAGLDAQDEGADARTEVRLRQESTLKTTVYHPTSVTATFNNQSDIDLNSISYFCVNLYSAHYRN